MNYIIDESLYGRISQTLRENSGRLPETFILNDANESGGIRIAEGNMDQMFHIFGRKSDPKPLEQIVTLAAQGRNNEALARSREVFEKEQYWFVSGREDFEKWLDENRALAGRNETVQYAEERMRLTCVVEELKFLIDVCGYMENYDQELREMLMVFSMSGELSAYCYPSLRKFPDGNEKIFEIAEHSDGHARAEAIYALNADTEEKKRWLIEHGRPHFLGWYATGAVVARKCDFASRLKNPDLSTEDRDRMGWITSTFFEEGPAVELNKLKDWEGICRTYIHLVRENPTTDGIEAVAHEYECLESESDRKMDAIDRLMEECLTALHDEKVLSFAKEKIEQGMDLELSDILNLPVNEKTVIARLESDPRTDYRCIRYLNDPELVHRAFEILFDQVDFSSVEDPQEDGFRPDCAFCLLEKMNEQDVWSHGDEAFRKKCLDLIRYGLYSSHIMIQSHAENAVEKLEKGGVDLPSEITGKLEELRREEEAKKAGWAARLRKRSRNAGKTRS